MGSSIGEPLFQIVQWEWFVECNLIGSNLSLFGEDCYRSFFKHIHMWPGLCEIIIVMWRFSDVQFLCFWCDVIFLCLVRGAGYKLKVKHIHVASTQMRSSQDAIKNTTRATFYIYMFRRPGKTSNVKSKLHLPPASWEQFRIPLFKEWNNILPTSTMALVGFYWYLPRQTNLQQKPTCSIRLLCKPSNCLCSQNQNQKSIEQSPF